jgi:hypothetical protein
MTTSIAINGLSPYQFPDLYSSIILGTMRSPGVVTLSGHDRDENWDIQKAKGNAGATSKLNGADLGEFQASFYLCADSNDENGENDFTRWEAFQDLIDSTTSGPKPIALPIYHPDLCRNRYTEVVKRSVSGLVWDLQGGATVVVKFGEHRPPKPKPAAKATAKPDENCVGTRIREDPNEAAKQELASLVEQARTP